MLNPPTSLQEDTIHNMLCTMSILHPKSQDILPRWHLSVVLRGLMKPPFNIDGSDRNISFELISYKTASLVTLATGSRRSELVAQSRAEHNITFSKMTSGAKHVSVRMVSKWIPKNARPDTIPKPLAFPGIAHMFSTEPERLLCPVRTLGLYNTRSAELAENDTQQKLFLHFMPNTQMFTTHFRCWVAETIHLTYENSSESDLPKIKAHDVQAVAASIAYYRNTPLKELCGLIGLEVLQCLCSPLSSRHGGRHEATGPPSHGHGNRLTLTGSFLSYSSLTTSTNVVNFGSLSMSGGNIQWYNVRFPNRTLCLQNVPTRHSSSSRWWASVSASLALPAKVGILMHYGIGGQYDSSIFDCVFSDRVKLQLKM